MPTTPKPPITPLEKAFEACIHCGMCLSACPTYVHTGDESQSPRGRIHLSQAVHEGRLPLADLAPALESCLGCLACETACPSQVKYHDVLEAGRLAMHAKGLGRFSRLAQTMQAIVKQDALLNLIVQAMQLGNALGLRSMVQAAWWPNWVRQKTRFWLPNVQEPLEPCLRRVDADAELALHLGCVMKHLMPDVHNACVHVLSAMGFTITKSPLGCCGALASHHGLAQETQACLKENARAWGTSPPKITLSNAGGCGAMLKAYAHVGQTLGLNELHPVLSELAAATEDIHAFIEKHHERLPDLALPTPLVVTYQASCHLLHGQGIGSEPLHLLKQVKHLTLVPLAGESSCCGSAGIYNLEHPELAQKIAQEKVQALLATGADVVVVGNPGCLIQLKASLAVYAPTAQIAVLHPMQVLSQALGGSISHLNPDQWEGPPA